MLKGIAFYICSVGIGILLGIGCETSVGYKNERIDIPAKLEAVSSEVVCTFEETTEPQVTVELEHKLYTEDEVIAVARTLAGECYDDKTEDKRRVAEVIVNRASDGRFGGNIIEVVTAKGQFYGYWNPSRDVSENDILIAEQTLSDWYNNDYMALSEYLYFCAGPDRENIFRGDLK